MLHTGGGRAAEAAQRNVVKQRATSQTAGRAAEAAQRNAVKQRAATSQAAGWAA